MHKSDCLVLGAGIVGLAAALLASLKGLSVVVVDQASSPAFNSQMPLQARTLALNHATLVLLDTFDVWRFIDKKRLGFMDCMRVVDEQGAEFSFHAPGKGDTLSIVIEYAHLAFALYQACLQNSAIHFYFDHPVESVAFDEHQVRATVGFDQCVEAKVVVGADGVHSSLVSCLHLPIIEQNYHHTACVGLAKSENGLFQEALQTCGEDYILGILPMGDLHWHSIIFSCSEAQKKELLDSDDAERDAILTRAACYELGSMQWQTPFACVPLIRHHLKTYVANRAVIIGDAAHRIHPLAGQGANMGLSDAKVLMDCLGMALKNHQDIGSMRVLKQYELRQKPKNALWLMAHDALKNRLTDASLLSRLARQFGFKLCDQNKLLTCVLKKVVG
jgi:2-octaprenylphenol hydroxylase